MKNSQPLKTWISNSYIRSTLLPFIAAFTVILGIYIFAEIWYKNRMTEYTKTQADTQLSELSQTEAHSIENQLDGVVDLLEIYQHQTSEALQKKTPLDPDDHSRLTASDGMYYTTSDRAEGGAAVFFSGIQPIGAEQKQKVSNLLAIQSLMKNIHSSNPLVASIYLNTYDSLNVIYPYFDVISQYAPYADIPTYNFYYEADLSHNPRKEIKWTGAYLDPAGHGWMISSIAPVYHGDFLEGVVGIDMTVEVITQRILQMNLPWGGYGMLIGSDGTILALPETGEDDWGLKELTEHHYSETIFSDTFKPEDFNLRHFDSLKPFSDQILLNDNGSASILLQNKPQMVSWHNISNTGWKLLLVVPESNIYQHVHELDQMLLQFGFILTSAIIVFYFSIVLLLTRRAKRISNEISLPLLRINELVAQIGQGNYYHETPVYHVDEMQSTVENITRMGRQLGQSNQRLLEVQAELKKRESDLESVVNSIDDILIEVDSAGTYKNIWTRNNDAVSVTYQANATNSIDTIFDSQTGGLLRESLSEVMRTGQSRTLEYKLTTAQGIRWFQARISYVQDTNNAILTARDITEKKDMELQTLLAKDEAIKANKAKTVFLSNMSHELRTPLNAVLGFAQLLEMDDTNPMSGEQKEYVNEITKASKHLLELINDVLDLAKIETGKITVNLEPVTIKSVVEDTLMLMKPLAENNHIEIIRCQSECVNEYILADEMRVKQIIINLMSNAIKYNKPNGKVYLSCKRVDHFIEFSVRDTGIGIPEPMINRIFDPFQRLHVSDHAVEGSGVGLSVVKNLVSLMNGSIHVESEVNVGSTFRVLFPTTSPENIQASSPEPVRASLPSADEKSRKSILYIEDNPASTTLVKKIIEKNPNFIFMQADLGIKGIELAVSLKPSIILLDINLPDMSGYEVLKCLKSMKATEKIPVIAVSASVPLYAEDQSDGQKFTEYLTKPIDVTQLLQIIDDL